MEPFPLKVHRLFLVFIMLATFCTIAAAASPIVWAVDGMQRLNPDALPEVRTSMELFAARGEYEPFQIIVRGPSGGLSNVNVLAQDLIGPGGHRISKSNITLYREHYVYLSRGSSDWRGTNRPLGAGWYPEPLIPFVHPETGQDLSGAQLDAVPFEVKENKNQGIWVDLFVPRDTPPGQYTGKLTVTSEQGQVDVDLALTVWNFELPLKPVLKSAFLIWEGDDKQSYLELLKHKLMPLEAELRDAQDKYLRLYAEFENFRKKALRDREEMARSSRESLIYELLPVLDSLEIALKHAGESGSGDIQSLREGVENTAREFLRTLGKFGVREIEALGKTFDPAYHHAMTQTARDDVEDKTVVEEFRKGYLFHDKVLRASLVAVSKKAAAPPEAEADAAHTL